MKIRFFLNADPFEEAKTWKDVIRLRKKYKNYTFRKGLYYQVLSLGLNKDFEIEINKSRKVLGLPPEGLEPKQGFELMNKYRDKRYKKKLYTYSRRFRICR